MENRVLISGLALNIVGAQMSFSPLSITYLSTAFFTPASDLVGKLAITSTASLFQRHWEPDYNSWDTSLSEGWDMLHLYTAPPSVPTRKVLSSIKLTLSSDFPPIIYISFPCFFASKWPLTGYFNLSSMRHSNIFPSVEQLTRLVCTARVVSDCYLTQIRLCTLSLW